LTSMKPMGVRSVRYAASATAPERAADQNTQ
jgi:hypothetical protein